MDAKQPKYIWPVRNKWRNSQEHCCTRFPSLIRITKWDTRPSTYIKRTLYRCLSRTKYCYLPFQLQEMPHCQVQYALLCVHRRWLSFVVTRTGTKSIIKCRKASKTYVALTVCAFLCLYFPSYKNVYVPFLESEINVRQIMSLSFLPFYMSRGWQCTRFTLII